MFRYYKSAFKNAKPQLLKALLFALISFAVCFIVYRFASAFIAQFSTQMQMLQQFGQSVSLTMYIPIIIIYLILALLFIFLGYQLLAGAINVIQKAMKHEKIKFSDLFLPLKRPLCNIFIISIDLSCCYYDYVYHCILTKIIVQCHFYSIVCVDTTISK